MGAAFQTALTSRVVGPARDNGVANRQPARRNEALALHVEWMLARRFNGFAVIESQRKRVDIVPHGSLRYLLAFDYEVVLLEKSVAKENLQQTLQQSRRLLRRPLTHEHPEVKPLK